MSSSSMRPSNRVDVAQKNSSKAYVLTLWDEILNGTIQSDQRIVIQFNSNDQSGLNNENIVYEFRMKPIILDQSECHLILIRDIQELSKVEYARSLEKLSEIMIASTSHDMRTPLNTTMNML